MASLSRPALRVMLDCCLWHHALNFGESAMTGVQTNDGSIDVDATLVGTRPGGQIAAHT